MKLHQDQDIGSCDGDTDGRLGELPWWSPEGVTQPTTGGGILGHVLTCSQHDIVMIHGTLDGKEVTYIGEVRKEGVRLVGVSLEQHMTENYHVETLLGVVRLGPARYDA